MELTPPLQPPEAPLPLQPPPEGLHPANYPTLGQFLKKHSPGEGARQPGQDFTPWGREEQGAAETWKGWE